ncbi:MAG: hypothetical protein ACE5GX_03490 [Thermoanaerobaculia bacterium]
MNKALAILAAAALFASGLAIGALGVHLFYSQKVTGAASPPMPVGPMFERWVVRYLDLNKEQRGQVREILEHSRIEAEELRREMGPRLEMLNRQTTEAIAEVLTPEQRAQFERFMERRQRRRHGFRGEGPPHGRRPDRRPRP